jgi:hypothetical protein
MKINTLGFWKNVTTWGGSIIAVSGLCYGASLGKFDLLSGSLTGSGIVFNALGTLIGMAQSKRQKENREYAEELAAEAQQRIEELEGLAYEHGEIFRDPAIKEMLQREMGRYADEHQDDGR